MYSAICSCIFVLIITLQKQFCSARSTYIYVHFINVHICVSVRELSVWKVDSVSSVQILKFHVQIFWESLNLSSSYGFKQQIRLGILALVCSQFRRRKTNFKPTLSCNHIQIWKSLQKTKSRVQTALTHQQLLQPSWLHSLDYSRFA